MHRKGTYSQLADYWKSKGTQLKLSTSHEYGTQPKINRTTHAKGMNMSGPPRKHFTW